MRRWRSSLWRSSEKDAEELLPSYDDFQPLETEEQEEMVQSFEKSHTRQNIVWRGIFSALLSSFAGFFIYSAHNQAVSPWDMVSTELLFTPRLRGVITKFQMGICIICPLYGKFLDYEAMVMITRRVSY
eukprot:Gb_18865 [translate_table: standard]